ncbi:hypothetical protein GCM10020358_68220 [Amorphoplanes nipponensis]|uniref:Uncharacterized protein n=1 Tax=Actinoplanes nipponensis TaxID=135950 RepID=A0A919JIV5_9ACTN|nr:hypothetical protein Ani05nite_50870 [Actinoplanes nipponensis]
MVRDLARFLAQHLAGSADGTAVLFYLQQQVKQALLEVVSVLRRPALPKLAYQLDQLSDGPPVNRVGKQILRLPLAQPFD